MMYHLSYLDIKHQSPPPTPSVSRFSGTLAGKGLYKSFDEHFVHQNLLKTLVNGYPDIHLQVYKSC